MKVFLVDSKFDGILTGVYEAYASRLPLQDCRLEFMGTFEPRLFCEYKEVSSDSQKAEKVVRKVRSYMSEEAYIRLYRAALHKSPDRADWILRFIIAGLANGRRVMRLLQIPAVYEIFQMDRAVGNEAHALVEFIRFRKLSSGIFFGTVGPENDVLELTAEHFSDRFPDMDWLLFDEKRKKAAFHSKEGWWSVRENMTESETGALWELGAGEPAADRNSRDGGITAVGVKDPYEDLWRAFFSAVSIEERRNPKCQRTMLPLRYRKYMTEF